MRESLDDVLKRQEEQVRKALEEQKKRHEAEEMKEAAQECDHTDKWKVAPGPYAFVRFCSGCGKSWRMWVKPDFPGECPVAEWEEIAEPVEQRILPDYEE